MKSSIIWSLEEQTYSISHGPAVRAAMSWGAAWKKLVSADSISVLSQRPESPRKAAEVTGWYRAQLSVCQGGFKTAPLPACIPTCANPAMASTSLGNMYASHALSLQDLSSGQLCQAAAPLPQQTLSSRTMPELHRRSGRQPRVQLCSFCWESNHGPQPR